MHDQQRAQCNQSLVCAVFIVCGSTSGLIIFLLLPLVLSELETDYGYSSWQLGVIGSADLLGISLVAISALWWERVWPLRRVACLASLTLVLLNLLTLSTNGFWTIVTWRTLAGIASGFVISIGMAYLGRRNDANRIVAGIVFVQVAFTVLGLELLPFWMERFGIAVIYIVGAIFNAILWGMALFLPGQLGDQKHPCQSSWPRWPEFLTLGAIAVYFAAQAGIWGFLELWGLDVKLDDTLIRRSLSIASFVSLLGPVFVYVCNQRLGRVLPLSIAFVMQVSAMLILMAQTTTAFSYLLALVLFAIGWNVGISYQVSLLVEIDSTRKALPLYPFTYCLGYALGPAFMGIIVHQFGIHSLSLAGLVLLVIYATAIAAVVSHEPNKE